MIANIKINKLAYLYLSIINAIVGATKTLARIKIFCAAALLLKSILKYSFNPKTNSALTNESSNSNILNNTNETKILIEVIFIDNLFTDINHRIISNNLNIRLNFPRYVNGTSNTNREIGNDKDSLNNESADINNAASTGNPATKKDIANTCVRTVSRA
jgi:hypothetical protein